MYRLMRRKQNSISLRTCGITLGAAIVVLSLDLEKEKPAKTLWNSERSEIMHLFAYLLSEQSERIRLFALEKERRCVW